MGEELRPRERKWFADARTLARERCVLSASSLLCGGAAMRARGSVREKLCEEGVVRGRSSLGRDSGVLLLVSRGRHVWSVPCGACPCLCGQLGGTPLSPLSQAVPNPQEPAEGLFPSCRKRSLVRPAVTYLSPFITPVSFSRFSSMHRNPASPCTK